MSNTEKAVRKRIRKNFKAQVDDLILYCKVNIEVLDAFTPDNNTYPHGKIEAYRSVLKRLGVE